MSRAWPTTAYFFVVAVFVYLQAPPALGALISVLVDDTDPEILYEGTWNVGQICHGCEATLDPKQVYYGTWHDTTFFDKPNGVPETTTFNFTGSAISVYGIQEQSVYRTSANIQFFIDGELEGSYVFVTSSDNDTSSYNQELFSKGGLDEAQHTLKIVNGQKDQGDSLILLDYFVYMTNASSCAANLTTAPVPTVTVTTTPSTLASDHAASGFSDRARIAVISLATILGVVSPVFALLAWQFVRQRRFSARAIGSGLASDAVYVQLPPDPYSSSEHDEQPHVAPTDISTQSPPSGGISGDGGRGEPEMRLVPQGSAPGSSAAGRTAPPSYRSARHGHTL